MLPMKLVPAFKDYVWGGSKLKSEYGKKSELPLIAESWEFSCNANGFSLIEGSNAPLAEWLSVNEGALGAGLGKDCPILVKLIDAKEDLSVQVHPDDKYAMSAEGGRGKTEMWYIIDHAPGAAIHIGFNRDVSDAELIRAIEDESLEKLLNRITVRKGDVFFIPAGTVHAIGRGNFLAEIQQNSDITYRLYDYGRKDDCGKQRELHIKKALAVLNRGKFGPITMRQSILVSNDCYREKLVEACEFFSVCEVELYGKNEFQTSMFSFELLLATKGRMLLRQGANELEIDKGSSTFLPAGLGPYTVEGRGEYLRIFGLDWSAYV